MPNVHRFASTGEAYNASQTSDAIRDGDVLVVSTEGVVGIMVAAWPTAVTEETGEFHGLADGVKWSEVPSYGWDDERIVTDYTASVAVAEAEVEALEDRALANDRELRKAADELGIELAPSRRIEGIELKRAARALGLADELGIDLGSHSVKADRNAGEVI